MKNYFAKLRENEEKGFSLVELIIVMAIMAILVGVVASQVIPYMEKSRQSKDQQQISSVATTLVSAIAQCPDDYDQANIVAAGASFTVKPSNSLGSGIANTGSACLTPNAGSAVEAMFLDLMGEQNWTNFANTYLDSSQKKFKSKNGKSAIANGMSIKLDNKGKITVWVGGTGEETSIPAKLKVETE